MPVSLKIILLIHLFQTKKYSKNVILFSYPVNSLWTNFHFKKSAIEWSEFWKEATEKVCRDLANKEKIFVINCAEFWYEAAKGLMGPSKQRKDILFRKTERITAKQIINRDSWWTLYLFIYFMHHTKPKCCFPELVCNTLYMSPCPSCVVFYPIGVSFSTITVYSSVFLDI